MKARNIIPDWPRGTSTSKPYNEHLPCWTFAKILRRRWSLADVAQLEDEQADRMRYHAAQARMMDDWHHSRSQATSVLAHKLFVGELSRPDFPKEKRWQAESPFVELVRAKSAERTKQIMERVYAGRPYYEPLEDHIWPTYGGITRNGGNGAYTTPSLTANWTPSDAGNITLKMLQDLYATTLHPTMAFPAFYRCHPETYEDFKRKLPEPPKDLQGIQFIGISIHQDPTVPLGEFWPPEGWKSDAD